MLPAPGEPRAAGSLVLGESGSCGCLYLCSQAAAGGVLREGLGVTCFQ